MKTLAGSAPGSLRRPGSPVAQAGVIRALRPVERAVESLKVRARYPGRFQRVQIDADCALEVDMWHRNWRSFARSGEHERDLAGFLRDFLREDDVVFDVGAQIGLVTGPSSRRVGRFGTVFAFEPDPTNRATLRALIERNRLDNVRLWDCALGDRDDLMRFNRPVGSWGAFLANGESRMTRDFFQSRIIEEFECQMFRLDSLLRRAPVSRLDVLKIDVDGPEVAILQGAAETIARFRPVVVVEASRFYREHGYDVEDLFATMHGLGYDLFGAKRKATGLRMFENPDEIGDDLDRVGSAMNFFCFHREPLDARHRDARRRIAEDG